MDENRGERTQSNENISKAETKELLHKNKNKNKKMKSLMANVKGDRNKAGVNQGHEASAAGGSDDEDDEGGKQDKLGEPGRIDAVYCHICKTWFADNDSYLTHVFKMLCRNAMKEEEEEEEEE